MSESWASQKWSARTINYWRRVLSLALGHAVTTGKIARNVAGRGMVKPVKGPARQIQPLEPEQVSAFVEATRGRSMEHMFMLDLCTGLREGELLGLRWSDVDQVGGWLTIRQELVWLNRRPYAFQEPKSEAGMRQVPLVPQAIAALRAQKARVAELELHCPPGAWTDHDLVFPSEVGTPIHPGNVNREFKKVLKVAGLPAGGFRPHDLRHGMATHLLEAGVDARIVMQLMGWSQSSMLKRYQHVRTAALNDARERLGGRLASIPGLAASGS
jgi:integrase